MSRSDRWRWSSDGSHKLSRSRTTNPASCPPVTGASRAAAPRRTSSPNSCSSRRVTGVARPDELPVRPGQVHPRRIIQLPCRAMLQCSPDASALAIDGFRAPPRAGVPPPPCTAGRRRRSGRGRCVPAGTHPAPLPVCPHQTSGRPAARRSRNGRAACWWPDPSQWNGARTTRMGRSVRPSGLITKGGPASAGTVAPVSHLYRGQYIINLG